MSKISLVIHGGAGNFARADFNEAQQAERLAVLHEALTQGYAVLKDGGTALDAITRAVVLMEDCPLYNAARGAVLNAAGAAELDAGVMDGQSGRCGGVSAVKTIKNPILAACAVMEQSPHSLLCGAGAEDFAARQGLEIVANSYFETPARRAEWARSQEHKTFDAAKGLGTVGAAARDAKGNLAAATSTGGLTGKLPGRVSDSSVAGAGTWAANSIGALSCTGTGDVFIRNATARDIACLIEYKGLSLAQAIREGLRKVEAGGGIGGIIGVAPDGGIVMDYNTTAMFRGSISSDSTSYAALF